MSLIVTSSSQAEYDQTSNKSFGIENPASYQNFLSSPLIVEPNSEIAVVSIKCNRNIQRVTIKDGDGLFVYWGYQNPENMAELIGGADIPHSQEDVNCALRIELRGGIYTRDQFADHLQARLEAVVKKAYREVKSITVSENLASNVFIGWKIEFIQYGESSGFSDKPAPSEVGAYIDATTNIAYTNPSVMLAAAHTDNFVASASGTATKIVGLNTTNTATVCDVIGKAHPLGQVNSKCVIYFDPDSSGAGHNVDGYTLGLIRSQGGTSEGGSEIDFVLPGGQEKLIEAGKFSPLFDLDVNIPPQYQTNISPTPGPPMLWDVAFNWVQGKDGQVIQLVHDNDDDFAEPEFQTITLANTPTNADLNAKAYDRVEFHIVGEVVKIYLGLTGKTTLLTLVDGSNTAFGSRVKPLGISCNALYPKIGIHNVGDQAGATPGVAWIDKYNGHSDPAYYENDFWGYSDIEAKTPMKLFNDLYVQNEFSSIYGDNTFGSIGNGPYVYRGVVASGGLENKWSLLLSDYVNIAPDYFFEDSEQPQSLPDNGTLRDILGYTENVLTEVPYAIVTDNGKDVEFISSNIPDFTLGSSMFIRLKNQALNSYNANKRSISNIIYSCPRFDNNGNQDGLLHYEPNERVYVKFNNVSQYVMNSIDIDIVDVNEKVIEDMVGNTMIVLHCRQSSDMLNRT
jgi:hypothetical protein